jgi:hypothetical protein
MQYSFPLPYISNIKTTIQKKKIFATQEYHSVNKMEQKICDWGYTEGIYLPQVNFRPVSHISMYK